MTPGVRFTADGATFTVIARDATGIWLCLFDGEHETCLPMMRDGDAFRLSLPDVRAGQHYGYRAAGPWVPDHGLLFDDSKLLVDPYALELDRRFISDPCFAQRGVDTAALAPKAVASYPIPVTVQPPLFRNGGLIYEINVRGFTMRHPDISADQRGSIGALAHPTIISHLKTLGVAAVELMPVVAWIDECHLPPLGLRNGWGYNPVTPMALDPGLAPGGIAELRDTVGALRRAGIGVILDLVLNHSGESDAQGPTLSLRGLDRRYYARAPDGMLINDTGTGNTLNAADPMVRQLMLDTLRHFVRHCGVDGFRLDLATVLARGPGFDAHAPIFAEIAADPLLRDRVMIAEPWDIGPGGYQLGHFPSTWLEWNDRYRDDVRRFWRGDERMLGKLATRMMGSPDIFSGPVSRSVNFLAAHDGFTLADVVSFCERHNGANGENNHDGHADEVCWNNGAEGPTTDLAILARRDANQRALLATLFASRGTIMLTAGDEFGRTQRGNNNAYAQDNETSWLDWEGRDRSLEDFVGGLAQTRRVAGIGAEFISHADWKNLSGRDMTAALWDAGDPAGFTARTVDTTLTVDRDKQQIALHALGVDANPP